MNTLFAPPENLPDRLSAPPGLILKFFPYLGNVFEVFISNHSILVLHLLHAHDVQLQRAFLEVVLILQLIQAPWELAQHIVDDRLEHNMKTKNIVLVIWIQYSITFHKIKKIIKQGQDGLVHVPPQACYSWVVDTATHYITSTRWSSCRMTEHIMGKSAIKKNECLPT